MPPTLADCGPRYLKSGIVNVTYLRERVAKGHLIFVNGGALGWRQNGTGNGNENATWSRVVPYTNSAVDGSQVDIGLCGLLIVMMGLMVLVA